MAKNRRRARALHVPQVIYRILAVSGLVSAVVFTAGNASARKWVVEANGGGDSQTIQAAILMAAENDTIEVGPGTYRETVYLTGGRHILLKSRSGADVTVIDGEQVRRCLEFDAGIVDGFTIRNGRAEVGAGVAIGQANTVTSPVLRNSVIEDNRAAVFPDCCGAAGVLTFAGGARIENNVIRNNHTEGPGGGILDQGFDTQIVGNVIAFNSARNGGGISSATGSIRDNIIVGNFGRFGGGGASLESCAEFGNNTVFGNSVATFFQSGAGVQMQTGFGCRFEDNIVVANHGSGTGNGMGVLLSDVTIARCNNVWGNDIDSMSGIPDASNFSTDPLFCAADPLTTLNFLLRSNSPCLPGASPTGGCGQIGAVGVGCGTVSIEPVRWGQVKRMYR